MSIAAERLSLERKRRYAAAALMALLLLSVFWPSPIVTANRLWFGERLTIDDLSFLGREAPAWDAVFWCIAGVLLLAIIQTAEWEETATEQHATEQHATWRRLSGGAASLKVKFEKNLWPRAAIGVACGAVATLLVWLLADAPLIAWSERIQSDVTEDIIRIVNRLGGGMNPVLVVVFFLVAGAAYRERRWIGYAWSMAIAGLVAGIGAQIVKQLVGRARPELWLGPSHYAPGSSTSFPSGHTVGAFALAGILLFASPSRALRVFAVCIAIAVAAARVLAFRHWPSDVTASASVGLVAAWLATRAVK